MKIGWNQRYVLHCLFCKQWIHRSFKLSALSSAVVLSIIAFPISTEIGFASQAQEQVPAAKPAIMEASLVPAISLPSTASHNAAAVGAIDTLLAKYDIERERRDRVANAIVTSSRKHNLDARLVASVMIVESRGDAHAISDRKSVGLMQIHLPTWGRIADKRGIDLFKVEDNVDLGAEILKGYISQYGMWDGVAHYTGQTDSPESRQMAADYVHKVQRIYGFNPPEGN
jgi:soluble lytic murein transglycosylase-like protein